jgi:hypothetical protein
MPPEEEERPLAIVDIDGVVADVRHRLHHVERQPKDWKAFFAAAPRDPVHTEGVLFVEKLARDHEVVFLTGRPENLRRDTAGWLQENGMGAHRLVMRPHGDHRPARQMKVHLLRDLARERQVAVVVDDDLLVVESMRKAGYPVLHADWEARTAEDEQALRSAQEDEGRS